MLAKYKFAIHGVQPFIGVGPSFRRPQAFTHASPYGVVGGAGIEFRLLQRLRITPAIRYTHWSADEAYEDVRRNQSEFLLGFSF